MGIIGKRIETEEDLATAARYWQELLRLRDWNITTQLVAPQQFKNNAYSDLGQTEYWDEPKDALIRILAPGFERVPHDQEDSVAHEHLHVSLRPLTAILDELYKQLPPAAREPLEALARTAEEQIVNVLAGALVTLKRQAEATEMPEVTSGGAPEAN